VAAEVLAGLRDNAPPAEELAGLGDMLMLPTVVNDTPEDQLARIFGAAFLEAVMPLNAGQWEGPVESGYGLHLVKITRREESRIPEWTAVRDRLVSDMLFEGRQAAEDQLYAEILPRYQVVFSEAVAGLLEGED
jgi:hypothetical protein